MRRPRWTLRALMAGVAVVGVAIGSGMEYMRLSALAAGYRAKAIKHAETRDAINQICKPTDPLDISAGPRIRSKRFTAREVVELEASLSRKYDRAARRPWISVEPDPIYPPTNPTAP